MNKRQNTTNHSHFSSENNYSHGGLWFDMFFQKSILNFGVLPFSIEYHKKLQIIYANIRV